MNRMRQVETVKCFTKANVKDYDKMPEYSLQDFCALCAQVSGGKVIEHDKLYVTYQVPYSLWYHRNHLETRSALVALLSIQQIKKDGAKGYPLFISYSNYEEKDSLEAVLKKESYEIWEQQIGMNFDLTKEVCNPGVVPMKQLELAHIKEWIGCRKSEGIEHSKGTLFERLSMEQSCKFYAYTKDGEMVGIALLHLQDKKAGIHEIFVKPKYRRIGIGKDMLYYLLAEAKKAGAMVATLQTSAMGERVCTKLGFEKINSMITYRIKTGTIV